MRTAFWMAAACLMFVSASWQPALAQDAKSDRHNWSDINYPRPPAATVGSLVPDFTVRNGKDDGLEFVIWYRFRMGDDDAEKKLPPIEKTSVRLHTADGKVADSKPPIHPSGAGSHGITFNNYPHRFGWRRNVLEEAWIEVRLPEQTYWVEVPYGFTRNPADSLKLAAARSGRPKYPPTMKPGKTDWLIPWLDVSYNLGKIQDGWGLSLRIANSFAPRFEVVLYRDDFKEGEREHLWSFGPPRTEMQIKLSKGTALDSKRMSIRLHDDDMRRSDSFKLNGIYDGPERCWGTVVVKLDGKGYERIVPSSLFWDQHGATDPGEHYKAFVPRLREP